MKYTSKFDKKKNICIIHVTGEYHRYKESEELKRFTINFSSEHGCSRFLINMTQAKIIESTFQTFKAAQPQKDIFYKLLKLKTAFLYNTITTEETFLENVAVNRGLQVKVFDVFDKAIEWLEQK